MKNQGKTGFSSLSKAENDAFSELIEIFKRDQSSFADTMNLGIGVYQTEDGAVPLMGAVQQAERRIVSMANKSYPPMSGDEDFCTELYKFLCPNVLQQSRVAVVQTVAGSGALRLISELLAVVSSEKSTLWLPSPTWANFWPLTKTVMRQATYECLSEDQNAFSTAAFRHSLRDAQAGDAVLLQLVGNNPTGIDPNGKDLSDIVDFLRERELFPVVDAAYVGFGDGPDEDAELISRFLDHFEEAAMAFSGSKSFSLYSDRVGAAVFLTRHPQDAARVKTAATGFIRQIYSMPPVHGAQIVTEILRDPELRHSWCAELKGYSDRLQKLRGALAKAFADLGKDTLARRLVAGTGMFFLTGQESQGVRQLRKHHRMYLAPDGRANLSGLTQKNMERVAKLLAAPRESG